MDKTALIVSLICFSLITTGCSTGDMHIPFTHVTRNTDTFDTNTRADEKDTTDDADGDKDGDTDDDATTPRRGNRVDQHTPGTPNQNTNQHSNAPDLGAPVMSPVPGRHTSATSVTPQQTQAPQEPQVSTRGPRRVSKREEAIGIAAWRAGIENDNISIDKAEKNDSNQWVVKLRKNREVWTVYIDAATGTIDQYGKIVD